MALLAGAGLFVRSLWLRFRMILRSLLKQVKGWRHFKIADGVLVETLQRHFVRPAGRGASLREKQKRGVLGRKPEEDKDRRSIRRPARIRPLQKARTGFEPGKADGRQPFMPASIS